jgi:synaptobrevin family protein YKT6
MKVLQITISRFMKDTEEPVMLSEVSDLKCFGFFQRPTCQQLLNAFSKIVVRRIAPGQRITVEVDGMAEYQVHTFVRSDGLAGTFTADKDYPARVAYAKLAELMDQFSADPQLRGWEAETRPGAFAGWPPLQEAIVEVQDPTKFDKIIKIQKASSLNACVCVRFAFSKRGANGCRTSTALRRSCIRQSTTF